MTLAAGLRPAIGVALILAMASAAATAGEAWPAVTYNRSDWPPFFVIDDEEPTRPGIAVEVYHVCLDEIGYTWRER